MKGVILCGGSGQRLRPFTKVNNKHLLPMGTKLMIDHPLNALVNAGIEEILVVTGYEHAGNFVDYLGDGSDFNCDITYKFQKTAGGIAQALELAKNFVGDDTVCVLLGDNIFTADLTESVKEFDSHKYSYDAKVFLKQSDEPERFGVAEFDAVIRTSGGKMKLVDIEEKPKKPRSNYIVTGIYMYTPNVFDIIDTLEYSDRGELEITDINKHYVEKGTMDYDYLDGIWTDAGTHESYWRANCLAMGENLDEDI